MSIEDEYTKHQREQMTLESKGVEKKTSVYHKYIHLTEEDIRNRYVMVDVYHVLSLFGVVSQTLGHAIKKLLCPGMRSGGKSVEQDVGEAIWTLQRWQELEKRRINLNSGTTTIITITGQPSEVKTSL